MVNMDEARQIALSLAGTYEEDHFGRPSFRVNKKIFGTFWPAENRMMVKLSPVDQSVFKAFDASVFFPVPNKWGLGGATFVELSKVRRDMLQDALTIAWQAASAKKK